MEGDVVGCGHEASALPSRAACTPQSVTGTVPPVPGLPGLPVDVEVEPVPVQVPSAVPSRAAEIAQAETGAKTGTDPAPVVVDTWVGSHELLAVPSTATTTLQAFTGMTPSTGALWLASAGGQVVGEREPGVGHAHAVGRAIHFDHRAAGGDRDEDVGGLTLLGRGVGAAVDSWQSCFRQSPQ